MKLLVFNYEFSVFSFLILSVADIGASDLSHYST